MRRLLENYNCDIARDSVWIHANPSATAKSTFFYTQETGMFNCRSNYFTERENQNSFFISYTLSGQGLLKYRGETHTIRAGQAYFIDCMEHHLYKTADDEWNTCWVHFNGANARSYYALFKKNCPTVVEVPNGEAFQKTIFEIIERQKRFTAETELVCSGLILSLLTDLLRSAPSQLVPFTAMPDYLQRIIAYLDKHYAEDISLDDLAKLFSVSKYHLARRFKQHVGIPVHEYQIRLRIDLAKALLTSTSMSVNSIAHSVGIDHVSHFINLFKTRVNDTPLSYRKKWQHLA